MEKEYLPKSAMVIHAHPDDQEFTVAGTLAKWARAGCEIVSVVITSGDAGSNDPAHGSDYKPVLSLIREGEQKSANEALGVKHTVFLRYADGELVADIPLRKELTRLIRRFRPEVVMTGDPTQLFYGNGYVNHPDHRAAAQAAIDAVFPSAGTRLIFTDLLDEGLEPHNVKRLYVHGSEKPDTWVDISGTLEVKIAALKKHASQIGEWDVEKEIREWAAEAGREKGLAAAEDFRVMILTEEHPES